MELARLSARLAPLLAGLAVLWRVLLRVARQSRSPVQAGAEPEPKEGAGGAEAKAEPELKGARGAEAESTGEQVATGPSGAVEEKAPNESTVLAKPAKVGLSRRPVPTPAPADVARGLAENPQLEAHVRAAVDLHSRRRKVLEASASVETAFVPSASTGIESPEEELVISRVHAVRIMRLVSVLGLICLAPALGADTLEAGLSMGVLCVLVAAAALTFFSYAGVKRPRSPAADAVHAMAAVQQQSAQALWAAVGTWVAEVGGKRGLAWRSGVAVLVEVGEFSNSTAEFLAFVLEPGPLLRVHHYVVRPEATAALAPEAAWRLLDFLEAAGAAVLDEGPGLLNPGAFAARRYSRVRVVLSQKDSHRLSELPSMQLQDGHAGMAQDPCIFVSPASRMPRPWIGFGGSFTEASAVTLSKMQPDLQEEVLKACFDPEAGLGYTAGRIPMASCDFGLGNWTCGDLKDEDHELKDFSIEHYQEAILPMCLRATEIAGEPLWMLASPWSPPPWMKTKYQFNGDGHLRPECGRAWALHFARFIQEMRKAGVAIAAVSVQNEPENAAPWEACLYTGAEERDFVKDHLGPTLEEVGLGSVKILIWDHNRDGMFERAHAAYSDPAAAKYIWGCAYHWYGDACYEAWPERSEVFFFDLQKFQPMLEVRARMGFENLRRVAELHPEKHILFSEGCQELSGTPVSAVMHEWTFGERYATNIIADMNSGCEGWIDWNLLLDETGGPNHVGNLCLAPIICDTQKQEVVYSMPYFFLAHFSKFIRPGARRVLCSSSRDALEVTSFVNSDESLSVVVLNRSNGGIDFKLKLATEGGTQTVPLNSPANSIMTLVLE